MSQPSLAATRPISSTVSFMARFMRTAASREDARARASRLAGKSAEAQPPLRPLAPNPACSASRTMMRSAGSAFFR
jgi:hypothetical protein